MDPSTLIFGPWCSTGFQGGGEFVLTIGHEFGHVCKQRRHVLYAMIRDHQPYTPAQPAAA